MTDAEYERLVDARVQRALATDPRYRNAENAEEQAEAEREIEREIVADLEHRAWKQQVLYASRKS